MDLQTAHSGQPAPEREAARGDMALLVPHLDAAYNLARWLMRNETDAEDLVQEAYLRAFTHLCRFSRWRRAGLATGHRTQ